MNNFKNIIYENYIKNHNLNLYGTSTIEKFKKNAKALNFYFGKLLPNKKESAILEIGCGDGSFIYWLNSIGYNDVSGIDVSLEQITHGKSLGINNLECTDLFTFLKFKKRKFDLIIAKDVIEHFTRDEVFEILTLVNENLTSNGRFIIQVPNGEGLFYTSIFYGDYTHEMAYTASSINQIALNNNFSKSSCYPIPPAPLGLKSTVRSWIWQLIVYKTKFKKMIATGSPKGIFTPNLIAVIDK